MSMTKHEKETICEYLDRYFSEDDEYLDIAALARELVDDLIRMTGWKRNN